MATDEVFDELISSWLQDTAPAQIPTRVLDHTAERTRSSSQQIGWRSLPRTLRMPRFAPALGSAVVVVVAMAFAATLIANQQRGVGTSPSLDPKDAFIGVWISTSDADGGTQTMTVERSVNRSFEIVVTDTIATVCSGGPSRMTGPGTIDGNTLVMRTPDYRCDDGSEPQTSSGPPLNEQLRNLTFTRDAATDTLSVGIGDVWVREGTETPDPAPQSTEQVAPPGDGMWPQSTLEEVRAAQELADAGDPRYTWQVSRDRFRQPGQNHPIDAEFFARFFEQVVGWDAFLWDEAFAHREGLVAGDVVYVRCAPGETNALYPEGPGAQCAPTIDAFHYETVKIHVAQPVREGETGIWVVTGWEAIEPAEQITPPSDATVRAVVEPFLQARIVGEGAEDLADLADDDPIADQRAGPAAIPLLYATSGGAPYERSEFELVEGPLWPDGWAQLKVRLFAEGDDTVVEQLFTLEGDGTARPRLVYHFQPMGPAGPVQATTENGKGAPAEYQLLDGEVTYRATDPLEPSQDGFNDRDRVAIVGTLPDDGAPRRILLMLADPRPIGPDCAEGPAPADAAALAESFRSDPDFETTAPVAVTVGGIPALQMDVFQAPGAISCTWEEHATSGDGPLLLKHAPFAAMPFFGDRARLYLLDLPAGSEARVLAIATIADADSLEPVLDWATPVLDSLEFHAP